MNFCIEDNASGKEEDGKEKRVGNVQVDQFCKLSLCAAPDNSTSKGTQRLGLLTFKDRNMLALQR